MAKLAAAQRENKPVDGHAPGLQGGDLQCYLGAGISTDHECLSKEEAMEKAAAGMHILLRCGSAARSFRTLLPVLGRFPEQCMFCTDDKHPDELLHGYIDELVRTALAEGFALFDVLRAASLNPVRHYGLKMGLLQVGDRADWIEVDDLEKFRIRRTVLGGQVVAQDGLARMDALPPRRIPNHFRRLYAQSEQFRMPAQSGQCRVIGIRDGELLTEEILCQPSVGYGLVISDPGRDLLKLAVFNRYAEDTPPALALVTGFGMQAGALASSVAHDSHHLICVGTDDALMAQAANAVIGHGGGLAAVNGQGEMALMPLPVAGLMTTDTCERAAADYRRVVEMARSCGCRLGAPFMALSFLALPVIPTLKLTDRGLFDAQQFQPVDFWVDRQC